MTLACVTSYLMYGGKMMTELTFPLSKESYETWQNCVVEHCSERDRIVNDRMVLKSILEAHLKKFFDFNEIEYCDYDFHKVLLKWEKSTTPNISNDIVELGMPWKITTGLDIWENPIIVIEIYPFGIEE